MTNKMFEHQFKFVVSRDILNLIKNPGIYTRIKREYFDKGFRMSKETSFNCTKQVNEKYFLNITKNTKSCFFGKEFEIVIPKWVFEQSIQDIETFSSIKHRYHLLEDNVNSEKINISIDQYVFPIKSLLIMKIELLDAYFIEDLEETYIKEYLEEFDKYILDDISNDYYYSDFEIAKGEI